jgi:hypothetical protein
LVDGDAPGNTNDCGASLLGSKVAFGVGNPDTTIVSTNLINDGVWHQCVVTRQQSAGIINLYVDGNLQGAGIANMNSLNASANLLFGAIESGGGYFNGGLDEIKLFSRILGANEVVALYYDTASPSVTPTNLIATPCNGQVQLIWWELPAATSYNIKRSVNYGGPYAIIANSAVTGYTDTNVVNGTIYYYVVSAVNSVGDGTNSVQVYVTPSTLIAWFKADAITGIANGSLVSTWNDFSGNGYSANAPGGAPTYVTGAMNGLPVVRFTKVNSSCLTFNRPVQDDFTIMFVYQSSQNDQGTGIYYYQGAGLVDGEVGGVAADFGTSVNANGQLCVGTGQPDVAIHSGNGFNNGQPHVVTFERTRSTGALVLYVDGTQVATGTGGTQTLTAPAQLVLGAVTTGGGYLSGDIAEVKIFNAALPNSDRSAEENVLKCKYGLSGGAAPATPTGLAGMAGNRQISLSWVPTAGAVGYNLWRSTNNGGSYQPAATGLATAGYVDTNALSGRTNYYEVAAVDGCGASANSVPVGVFLPLPALGLNVSGNSLAISWPTWASDWGLYSATNLTAPILWLPVTNTPVNSNGVFNVTLPIGSGVQFFRLVSP